MKPGTDFPCPTCLNEMIKNINKRKELAEMTYGNYAGVLSAEEKNELENEVGACFNGYEKAMDEVMDIIQSGGGLEDIRKHIQTQREFHPVQEH